MDATAKPIWYDGTGAPAPEQIPLRAGPLSALFEGGDPRYVRLVSREIPRRVFAAVRDRYWGTILPRLANVQVERGDDRFRVSGPTIVIICGYQTGGTCGGSPVDNGKAAGFMVSSPGEGRALLARGFRCVAYWRDIGLYQRALREGIAAIRENHAEEEP